MTWFNFNEILGFSVPDGYHARAAKTALQADVPTLRIDSPNRVFAQDGIRFRNVDAACRPRLLAGPEPAAGAAPIFTATRITP